MQKLREQQQPQQLPSQQQASQFSSTADNFDFGDDFAINRGFENDGELSPL